MVSVMRRNAASRRHGSGTAFPGLSEPPGKPVPSVGARRVGAAREDAGAWYGRLPWVLACVLAGTPIDPAFGQSERGASGRQVTVRIDPRVELLSIIFRLAGNPEYQQGRVESYVEDVERHFGRFRDHPAVQCAAELRRTRGVSYDACMSMAVHLSDAYAPQAKVPFDPLPADLDSRWGVEGAGRFLEQAGRFVDETSFRQFIQEHRPLYELAESRMQDVLDKHAHLEWFDDFFGQRTEAVFKFMLAPLNGGSNYGTRCRTADGRQELYCILGVWKTDAEGMPLFEPEMLGTVVHEFCHSYTNPVIDRHADELEAAGNKLFPHVEQAMRRQAYGQWKTMMYESLVRACVVRYTHTHLGPEAARRAIDSEKARQFLWIGELSELLGEYEVQRDKYADLDAYFPRIVEFFNSSADQFAERQRQQAPGWAAGLPEFGRKLFQQSVADAARPQVVSISPANGATDVNPGLKNIRVVFDRPMAGESWSLVGGGQEFPELVGQPRYDTARTAWTVSVKLKPNWSYRFMLNSDRFQGFRSQDGVPLPPVVVAFRTRNGMPADRVDSPNRP